jgi:hypothetical protein
MDEIDYSKPLVNTSYIIIRHERTVTPGELYIIPPWCGAMKRHHDRMTLSRVDPFCTKNQMIHLHLQVIYRNKVEGSFLMKFTHEIYLERAWGVPYIEPDGN